MKQWVAIAIIFIIAGCTTAALPETATVDSGHTLAPTLTAGPPPSPSPSTTEEAAALIKEHALALTPIDEYMSELLEREKNGGTLYCTDSAGETTRVYTSCESFNDLRETGCFGDTTLDMKIEYAYRNICSEIETLKNATAVKLDYFNLASNDWWETLPAEVIPMRGGIYSPTTWQEENLEREKLVSGKLLGEIEFIHLAVDQNGLGAVLNSIEEDCGIIEDYFYMRAILLADVDGDGIAELLLNGYRSFQSESCRLGTANGLGAGFSILVKKDSEEAIPTIIDLGSDE